MDHDSNYSVCVECARQMAFFVFFFFLYVEYFDYVQFKF